MADTNKPMIIVEKDEEKVVEALCLYISRCADEAIESHGTFYVGVSG